MYKQKKNTTSLKNTNLEPQEFFKKFPEIRPTSIVGISDLDISNISYKWNKENIYILDVQGWSRNFKNLNNSNKIPLEILEKTFEFAFEGKDKHKKTRAGGSSIRDLIEIFMNIFIGKLGEYGTYSNLIKNDIELEDNALDYKVRERGDYDDYDLKSLSGKYFSIKSSKLKSNFMMLEEKNWTKDGRQSYNFNNDKIDTYDYHAYTKITSSEKFKYKPTMKAFYINKRSQDDFKNMDIEEQKNFLKDWIFSFDWHFDETYLINNEYFKTLINKRLLLKKNTLIFFDTNNSVGVLKSIAKSNPNKEPYIKGLFNNKNNYGDRINSSFVLDATNYYIPLKYMFIIKDYKKDILKEII